MLNGAVNEVTFRVTAEDGVTEATYTININKVFSTILTSVKVDGEEAIKDVNNKTYTAYVENTENHSIEVKAENVDAIVSVYDKDNNLIMTGVGEVIIASDSIPEAKKEYKIKIEGPGDYSSYNEECKLVVSKKSTDTTAKFYVNGTPLEKDAETGKYRIVTTVEGNTLRIETTDKFAEIRVDGGEPYRNQYVSSYQVAKGELVQINVTIISQNGESEDSVIEIVNLDNNTSINSITVNGRVATKVNNSLYRNEQMKDKTNAEVEVTLSDELATIETTVDGTVYRGTGGLTFNVPLSGAGTVKQKITVIAQDGSRRDVELDIVQNMSNDINVNVKVNGTLASKLDGSTYQAFVHVFAEDNVNIELSGVDEYTKIRYGEVEGNVMSFTQVLANTGQILTIEFTAVAESGETKDYTLYIMKESRDNTIGKLYVNGIEVQKGENGRYTAYVDNTMGDSRVKVETNNEYAYVRIGTSEEQIRRAEKVIAMGDTRTIVVPITIRSQSGETKVEYLDIIATYVVGNIEEVIVDDIEVTDYDSKTRTYTAIVDGSLEEHEVTVITDNNYVTVELGNDVGMGSVTTLTKIDNDDLVKEMTLYITGETDLTETYKIKLIRHSNNTNIEEIKVNDVILEVDPVTLQYYKDIDKVADKAKIKVITEYPYAGIKIGDCPEEYGHSSEVWVNLKPNEDEITIPVVITAVDGTTIDTYNIILRRVNLKIKGQIITDNAEGKHIVNVMLYDMVADKLVDTRESKKDGTYEMEATHEGTYKIVIEKLGYLRYTVTDIKVKLGEISFIDEYHLISGDVAPTGMIGLDDLVDINDNYGVVITDENKDIKGIYDLNEDGIVDELDRNLLVEHLDRMEETVQWVAPIQTQAMFMMSSSMNIMSVMADENGDFILPIECDYRVSSEYGYRIHPTTNEYKLHAGIDLVGDWHTDILSVADGEVTFAGTQNGYGNCVEIKHVVNGETIYSFYAHLSEIDVKVGDLVGQGEVIGLEGGAESDVGHGTSTGHHLHFELRTGTGSGHSIDPRTYMEF